MKQDSPNPLNLIMEPKNNVITRYTPWNNLSRFSPSCPKPPIILKLDANIYDFAYNRYNFTFTSVERDYPNLSVSSRLDPPTSSKVV